MTSLLHLGRTKRLIVGTEQIKPPLPFFGCLYAAHAEALFRQGLLHLGLRSHSISKLDDEHVAERILPGLLEQITEPDQVVKADEITLGINHEKIG